MSKNLRSARVRRSYSHRSPFYFLVVIAACLTMVIAGCSSGSRTGTPTPTKSPTLSGKPLNLVMISDSSGNQVGGLYAKQLEKGLGRPVVLTDWALPELTATGALSQVTDDPTVTAKADAVIVSASPMQAGQAGDYFGACFLGNDQGFPAPKVWTAAQMKIYRAQMDAIYNKIWKLRNGAPTILRAIDYYVPVRDQWKQSGIYTPCTANFEALSNVMRASAVAHGATFVSVYDLFNGPKHDQNPPKGYIVDGDVHTTYEGASAIAAAIAATGYSYNSMPSK